MPEIMFTPDREPIQAVRIVPPTTLRTIGGNPVRAVRLVAEPDGDVFTTAGFPIQAVRTYDAAGVYTTSQAPITTQPEDVFTGDGQPIEHVRIIANANSPELARTTDGFPIDAVRLVGAGGTDSLVDQWAAAVVANGGTVSAGRLAIVATFVAAEKAAGTWALTDDYWALWGENALQSRTSLKQKRLATEVAVPLWTIDRGYTFNGTTQYLNTGFIPASHKVAMSGTSLRIASYERTNVDAVTATMGATAASDRMLMYPRVGATLYTLINVDANTGFTLASSDSRGYTAGALSGTTSLAYKNGVALAIFSTVSVNSTALVNAALALGANNDFGTPGSFRAGSIGFAAVGAALSAAQEQAQYQNVQAWATAVGANV